MTEYILIVALIAIATIGVIGIFGNDIRKLFGMSSDSLSGQGSVATRTHASDPAAESKHLVNFAENNSGIAGGGGGNGPQH
jgi:Flp pilus assembly pilin Flp